MTEQEILNLGFKKKTLDDSYWFEKKVKGGHTFLTNDTYGAKKKDDWYIGYQHKHECFWFNRNLNGEGEFKIVFAVLTGYGFKLAHQRKRIIAQ